MDLNTLLATMEAFPALLRAACMGLSADQWRWKPESGAWSVLEIVGHLADEETDDFRVRVLSTLEDPERPWPKIDPEAAARDRRYNEQDPASQLDRFERERADSVRRVRALASPDWSRTHRHPSIGPLRAGDLMLSWAAHDTLHLRQIAKRRFDLMHEAGGGFASGYAGNW